MGNITKWLLIIFGALVILFNAVETALFGATYLPAAFGNPDNGIAALLAAGYVLLMLDAAYLVWFKVWLSGEQATAQRDAAIALAIVSLGGSIMATVTQLATNTTLAPYLIPYRPTIGTIAFFVILGVTVAHIVGLAVYKYAEPEQRVATETARMQGKVIDSALKELEARANADKDILVDILAAEFRGQMLGALGFTEKLQRLGKGEVVPGQVVANHKPPFKLHIDDLDVIEFDDLGRAEAAAHQATRSAKIGVTLKDANGTMVFTFDCLPERKPDFLPRRPQPNGRSRPE